MPRRWTASWPTISFSGRGKTYTKADLLKAARDGKVVYEHQEETSQSVRVWGDTAVVTALLWGKGAEDGNPFDYKLWFSDTYVRTPAGWRYAFGQASLPLPNATAVSPACARAQAIRVQMSRR